MAQAMFPPTHSARKVCFQRISKLALLASIVGFAGCSGDGASTDTGTVVPTGGTSAIGGSTFGGAGGALVSGGSGNSAGAAGGSSQSLGGGVSNGGTGGAGSTSLVLGGATSSGGTTSKGGATSSGGTTSKGGATSSGGTTSKGGATSSGGTTSKGGATSSGGTTGKSTFHVFLLLGQSNMAGYPKAATADKVEDPRIKVLGFDACSATGRVVDQWDTAAPPLHECWNSAIGPGDYFAKTLLSVIPSTDTIGLVPCAISGEKIETFLKAGGTKYSWIVSRAKLAQQAGGIIDGILFHQGESNSGDSTWPGKVKTLVTDLRTDLGIGNVPFLAGELLYSGPCAGHNTLVNQLPSLITNAYVVSASGLIQDPADTTYRLHFGHDSQVEFGKRYEAKMVQALGW